MSIPSNLRIPILAAEFDSSHAFQGPSILTYKALLVGQKIAAGTAAAGTAVLVTSPDQAATLFGRGSQLHLMFVAWFANNRLTQVYGLPLADDGAGVAATGTITITGPATAAGVIALYIAGQRLAIAVASGDSATTIATNIVAAITAATNLPVTATNASGVVTVTSRNKGDTCNDIDVRVNYADGEVLPAGVAATIVGMASGATNPTTALATAITALRDNWYQIFCCPYTDATSLTAWETELDDRFGAIRMIDGLLVTAKTGSLSALGTFGTGRNDPHVTVMDATGILNTPWEVAAAYAGQLAKEGAADPARPFQTLPLTGLLPPPIGSRRPVLDNNTLLYDGISTFIVDQGGVVRIQRAITMYQKNGAGAVDIAYLDVNTMLTLMFLRFDFRNSIQTKYPRAKLLDDGNPVPAGQSIITPKIGRSEAIAIFRRWQVQGLVQNADQFVRDLVVARNASDPNRLDWILPPNLANQFIVGTAEIQFLLAPVTP